MWAGRINVGASMNDRGWADALDAAPPVEKHGAAHASVDMLAGVGWLFCRTLGPGYTDELRVRACKFDGSVASTNDWVGGPAV